MYFVRKWSLKLTATFYGNFRLYSSTNTGRQRHYVLWLSVRPSMHSCYQTCKQDILKTETTFDTIWHKWSTGYEAINFGG